MLASAFHSLPKHEALEWRKPHRVRPSSPRWPYLQSVIHDLAFFRTLPAHVVRRMMMKMSIQYLPMEASIYRYGDRSSFLAILLKGEVSVLAPTNSRPAAVSAHTNMECIATLTAGDSFGAQSLIDGGARNTSVITVVECEVAILTRRDYLSVLVHRYEDENDRLLGSDEQARAIAAAAAFNNDTSALVANAAANADESSGADNADETPLVSLLDPAFITASSLPQEFELYPHLKNYIDILTKQTQRLQDEERARMNAFDLDGNNTAVVISPVNSIATTTAALLRRSSITFAPSNLLSNPVMGGGPANNNGLISPSLIPTVSPMLQSSNSTSLANVAAAAIASSSSSTSAPDAVFLLNLLKTHKLLQMHDRRSVLLNLTKSLTLHHFPPNTVLYEKDSPATYTYFVLSGTVSEMKVKSAASLARDREERRSRRQAVRAIMEKQEEAQRRADAEAIRMKEMRPHYMQHTAQYANAMKDNASLIAAVSQSSSAVEKENDRRERARLVREAHEQHLRELMEQFHIDTLEDTDDEGVQEGGAKIRSSSPKKSKSKKGSIGGRSNSPSKRSPAADIHQFPLGSCLAVRCYPDNFGWDDWERNLRILQEERLEERIQQTREFGVRELERASIIAAAAARGENMGSGAAASAAANQVLDELRREKDRAAAEAAAKEAATAAERASRTKRGFRRPPPSSFVQQLLAHSNPADITPTTLKRSSTVTSPSTASDGPPPSDYPELTSTASISSAHSASTNKDKDKELPPVYLSPSFEDVVHSSTMVTRESCWVARIPNQALLVATEAPFHGKDVIEKLNDPILRYTVMRPQDKSGASLSAVEEAFDEDPDALLHKKKNENSIHSGLSGSLDYSHHVEFLFTSMQHLKFFSIQNRELGLKLCGKMQYLRLHKGEILCKQGQLGSLFYIILSGSVSIHIKPQFVIPQLAQALSAADMRGKKLTKRKTGKSPRLTAAASPKPTSGAVMVQSLMFPTTSPVEQMKQQEKEQKEGEAALAQGSSALVSPTNSSTSALDRMKRATLTLKPPRHGGGGGGGSVMVQSLMFPSTSPVEQMKQQEREQKEGEERLKLEASSNAKLLSENSTLDEKEREFLNSLTVNLNQLTDPPSVVGRHLSKPLSPIEELSQLESLYGPCVKVALSGDPIGESAIVSSNPRSATCICREPVELFTLSKEDYRAIYAVPQHLKVNTIINLLHQTPDPLLGPVDEDSMSLSTKDVILLEHCIRDVDFMKPLHPSIRSILAQRLHHIQLEAGRVVFEQGTRGGYLYIVISGTCSVYMKPAAATPIQPSKTLKGVAAAAAGSQGEEANDVINISVVEEPEEAAPALSENSVARFQAVASNLQNRPSSAKLRAITASSSDATEEELAAEEEERHANEREAHDSIDAMEAELNAKTKAHDAKYGQTLHRRSNRTPSTTSRNMAAMENTTARPGAEMLSTVGVKSFKFSSGATVGAAAGGGRAFSAGRIRKSHLEQHPPVTDINLSEQEPSYIHSLGPVTSILSVSSSFGEAALQPGNGLHNCTVVTNGPTDLLLLTRASYAFALESLAQWKADLDEVFQFFKSSHFFHNWSPTIVSKAMNLMERREIKRNEVIIKQGQRASHIFFVLKGEIAVTQHMQLVDKEIKQLTGLPGSNSSNTASASSASSSTSSGSGGAAGGSGSSNAASRGGSPSKQPRVLGSKVGIHATSASKSDKSNDALMNLLEAELKESSHAFSGSSSNAPKKKKSAQEVTLQTILKEQRVEEDKHLQYLSLKSQASSTTSKKLSLPTPSYPLRTQNHLVSSLLTPQHGLPLFIPSLKLEDPVPVIPNSSHVNNFTNLITASQVIDGINPNTPIVDGGQIWLHFPQKLNQPHQQISSGCKRRGTKRIYKNTANNGTEIVSPNKRVHPGVGKIVPANEPDGAVASADAADAAPVVLSSPVFPFTVELASLSKNGICGNLETLLPTVLGVKDYLGRPETEEELARERERKEREALAHEGGLQSQVTTAVAGAAAGASASASMSVPAANAPNALNSSMAASSAPPSATQCQLAYPSTFTALTDCTLVAFPTNAFHTLLSLTEETAFLEVHLDRLKQSSEKIRRFLEGRFLKNERIFPRDLLDDFRIYEENLYYSMHRNTPEDVYQREHLTALFRPGIKPPALVDYRPDEQLKELRAAGLVDHPYLHSLEHRSKLQRQAQQSGIPVEKVVSHDIDQELSFSHMGSRADSTFGHMNTHYTPPIPQDQKAKMAREMLDTICEVSHANSNVPSVPGSTVFDPLKQQLPTAPSRTPEFQAALKYAEKNARMREKSKLREKKKNAAQGANSDSEASLLAANSLDSFQQVQALLQTLSPSSSSSKLAPATPTTSFHQTPGNSSPDLEIDVDIANDNHTTSIPTTPSPATAAAAAAAQNFSPATIPGLLSPLAKPGHGSKFFNKFVGSQRNPPLAAGMVSHLLADAPHELEKFLMHVKRQHKEDEVIKRRKKKAAKALENYSPRSLAREEEIVRLTAQENEVKAKRLLLEKQQQQQAGMDANDAAALVAAASSALEEQSRGETDSSVPTGASSGPKYALTSAVLALQSKSVNQLLLSASQREATLASMAEARAQDLLREKQHAKKIAHALCLPDPFSNEHGSDFSAKHIAHLQKVIRQQQSAGQMPSLNSTLSQLQLDASSSQQMKRNRSMPALSRTQQQQPLLKSPSSSAFLEEAKSPTLAQTLSLLQTGSMGNDDSFISPVRGLNSPAAVAAAATPTSPFSAHVTPISRRGDAKKHVAPATQPLPRTDPSTIVPQVSQLHSPSSASGIRRMLDEASTVSSSSEEVPKNFYRVPQLKSASNSNASASSTPQRPSSSTQRVAVGGGLEVELLALPKI